jgi:hypothetical protein
MRLNYLFIFLLILNALSSSIYAQEDESALSIMLDSITVKSFRYKSHIRTGSNNETIWDLKEMSFLPQILSNADPVRYAQTLPGIQTNSEHRSGINIYGCDNQHNVISINGVTIYNANHLLGIFSTFNHTHFNDFVISKGDNVSSTNRIGGHLDIQHKTNIHDKIIGDISLGIISSQGTLKLPINKKTSLTTSIRGSYLNLLYGKWLQIDNSQFNYSFYDVNATLVHRHNSFHTFMLDFYKGNDNGLLSDNNYLANINAKWGNNMLGMHWLFNKNDISAKTTIYFTSYKNLFKVNLQDRIFRIPSGISDLGIKSKVSNKRWSYGIEGIWHKINPQSVEQENCSNNSADSCQTNHSFETSLFVDYQQPIGQYITLSGALRGNIFLNKGSIYGAIDPSLRIQYDRSNLRVSATYALRHQYLFQSGFSDIGFPTEFWYSSDKNLKPQYAHELTLNSNIFLWDGRYKLSLDLFYIKLYHQLAYKGNFLDLVNTTYNLNNSLIHGKGTNYGLSIMINKCSGNLTGWLNYTFTKTRRSFNEFGHTKQYPASHERPHELNAVASYSLGKHWSFGGTFVYASGNPFTAAESVYLLNNNLILKYGEYNSSRLSPYIRLDLSVNYNWIGRKKIEHGFNVSCYNVMCRNNEIFYAMKANDTFVYHPISFIKRALPSICYNLKF